MSILKKSFWLAPAILLALSTTACKKHYLEGFGDGEVQGYNNGYGDGHVDGEDQGFTDGEALGFSEGQAYFEAHNTYAHGFSDGKIEGLSIGYNNGYTVGYQNGLPVRYNDGYTNGHADGLVTGYNSGYSHGHTDGNVHGYNNGYDDGHADGYTPAYNDGYDDGHYDGYRADHSQIYANAYNQGYSAGDLDGYDDGYYDGYNYGNGFNVGYNQGFNAGDAAGFTSGYNAGIDDGYSVGFDSGYDLGFDDGYDTGYWDGANGFSVASTSDLGGLPNNKDKKLNSHLVLASNLQADLVNFNKLKVIEDHYKKGLEAKLLEQASVSSKDLAKIATMREKFRVDLVASEIAGQYSLSLERSQKLATLSVSFRKLANHRAITTDDAEAFGKELTGLNLTQVISAVKDSKKGNTQGLELVLAEASKVNQVSKMQMSSIILKMFF